jgi:hypothetical protein
LLRSEAINWLAELIAFPGINAAQPCYTSAASRPTEMKPSTAKDSDGAEFHE